MLVVNAHVFHYHNISDFKQKFSRQLALNVSNLIFNTLEESKEKKEKAAARYTFLKTMADTQTAQFFIPRIMANKDRLMTDAEFRQILRGYKAWQSQKTSYASVIDSDKKFFHWLIEFPEVFQKWWMYGEKRPALYKTISK